MTNRYLQQELTYWRTRAEAAEHRLETIHLYLGGGTPIPYEPQDWENDPSEPTEPTTYTCPLHRCGWTQHPPTIPEHPNNQTPYDRRFQHNQTINKHLETHTPKEWAATIARTQTTHNPEHPQK